ncbi:MAG: hypothetical protein CM15mP46_5960 [Alphaproteobacteria bacterium]|nr:MAG: hypothetical protein CM15mP46_5960 [Alphaproteobacteria bacterium]
MRGDSAVMTGIAYATSAEMARKLVLFKFKENAKHMLRGMKKHQLAAKANQRLRGAEHPAGALDTASCPTSACQRRGNPVG